jgi:hypothetical protein
MNLILTLEGLLSTFLSYNLDIWPMQAVAYVLGISALVLAVKQTRKSARIISGILAFLWLWTGIVFFLFYFALVYTPAYLFGILFIIQGIVFLVNMIKPRVSFSYKGDIYGIVGLLFVAYAMLGYPLVGYLIGHIFPYSPPFGLTPCPLAVFTFGLYLLMDQKLPKAYLVIPLLWAIGGIMPVSVGILEDIGLITAGLLGTALILIRDKAEKG